MDIGVKPEIHQPLHEIPCNERLLLQAPGKMPVLISRNPSPVLDEHILN
jgi:hypothetical protein